MASLNEDEDCFSTYDLKYSIKWIFFNSKRENRSCEKLSDHNRPSVFSVQEPCLGENDVGKMRGLQRKNQQI